MDVKDLDIVTEHASDRWGSQRCSQLAVRPSCGERAKRKYGPNMRRARIHAGDAAAGTVDRRGIFIRTWRSDHGTHV